MTDASNEILLKLEALKASLDAGFSGVDGKIQGVHGKLEGVHGKLEGVHGKLEARFTEVNAKLDDIRNDIKVIAEARLAPLEQKQIRPGSSPNWPRPVDVDDLKEG